MTSAGTNKVAIWDLPVRICHWSFALIVPAMWWTAENSEMGWHMRLGLVLLGLVVFRILWGFLGSSTARFTRFMRGPGAVLAYFRGRGDWRHGDIGHNPAGGWSVAALLLAMLAQVSFGLFSGDPYDGATGPLNETVRAMTADTLTELHETFFYVLVALVALHLLAVVFYSVVKKDRIVPPMVTGKRAAPFGTAGMVAAPAWRFVVSAAIALAVVWWVASGGPGL